jgi:predicted nucleotidyltransferase
MAPGKDKQLIYQKIRDYVQTLERSNVPVWRLYLYGSYSKDTYHADSDIDLAVFWDRDDIDGFDEDVLLRKLCWDIDLRIIGNVVRMAYNSATECADTRPESEPFLIR